MLYCNFSAPLNRNIAKHMSKCFFTEGCQMKYGLITICSIRLYSTVVLKEPKNWCIHTLYFANYLHKFKKKEIVYLRQEFCKYSHDYQGKIKVR